ncbi:MAG: acetate uptake transporter [Pseudonocardiaceae bacterium]
MPLSARLADPVPLGLAGFGLTTFMLSMIEVGAISKTALPIVLGSALAYGGLLQLLAGMWAFVRHNTFAAVALGSYGAFWISYWALNTFYLKEIPAAEQASALGLFLISWAVFTFYMWLVSFRVNLGVMLVFLTLWPAYLLLGLGTVNASAGLTHIGGAFGIATALLAWYVSFAETLNNTIGKAAAPLVPFGQKVVDEPPHDARAYAAVAEKTPSGNR